MFGRDVGGEFLLHRDCRFVEIKFHLHRVRRCVEIGFYLHRDCRYIGRWGTRAETTLLLFHPRCKQNFVVVFVSFFLSLESIEQTSTSHKMLRNQLLQHVCKQGEMTSRSALYQTLTLKLSSSAQKCWRYVQFRLMIGEKQTR